MKKILVGMISSVGAYGLDNYVFSFWKFASDYVQVDCLGSSGNSELEQILQHKGCAFHVVCGLRNPIKQYRQVKKLIKKNHYDMVYLNMSTSLAVPVIMAAHDCGVERVVVHSHSAGFDENIAWKRMLMTLLHRFCKVVVCRIANEYLTCSDKASQWMFTKKVNKSGLVKRIQNTVDVSRFCFDPKQRTVMREKLQVQDKFVVGMVGNMSYVKNHRFIIDVFARVAKQDSDSVLIILGDGELRGDIEQQIRNCGLQNRVMLLGQVKASDGYMSMFDLFVMPSHFEGMPIVSIEAQCSGLSCIFSDCITSEAQITKQCRFLSIERPELWVSEILNEKKKQVKRHCAEFDLSPYSVETQNEVFRTLLVGEEDIKWLEN